MEDDNSSLLSDQDSIDPERASLEAERQSLYGDTESSSEAYSQAITQYSKPTIRSPKVQEGGQSFFPRDAPRSANSPDPEPIRDAGPAPPDYAAATGGYYGTQHIRNYSTISNANRGQQHYPPSTHWPASGLEQRSDERAGLIVTYAVRRKKQKRCCGGRCGACCWFFFRFVSLTLAVLLILAVCGVFNSHSSTHIMPPDNGHRLPIPGDYDGHGTDPHPPTSSCRYTSTSKPIQFDFEDIESFSLVETLGRETEYRGDIHGYIWLVPAGKQDEAQAADLRVWTSVATTELWSINKVMYDRQAESLELKFPSLKRSGNSHTSRGCMNIAMVVMVRQGVSLQSLDISTVHLDVKVFESLTDIGFELDQSHIDATTGHVSLEYWSSRETRISTVSGNVHGTFALRDLLQISTMSGNIESSIDPKKADPKHPLPARYIAKSKSGSIRTTFPTTPNIPSRDYQTEVEGTSSTIKGTYFFQSLARLRSVSGTMDVDLIPYSSTAKQLRTESTSSNHIITLSSPYSDPGTAIKGLKSYHGSISGTVNLRYPQEWEGKLEGDTVSGNVKLEGRDLEGAGVGGGSFRRHFEARKGKGDSEIYVETMSGDVRARLGGL